SYFVGDFLKEKVHWEERYITIIAFAITFAIIVLAISLLGKLFTKLADFAYLGWINKALGGVFGAMKLALILSVILMVFDKLNNTLPFVDKEDIEKSTLYEPVKTLAAVLFPNWIHVVSDTIENPEETE
ncbi:MAG TPA: CvpA family protein, partial [Saprospiraceae bacterium]|nr:CvpA family protein [Saprospiraceae bacterium]